MFLEDFTARTDFFNPDFAKFSKKGLKPLPNQGATLSLSNFFQATLPPLDLSICPSTS